MEAAVKINHCPADKFASLTATSRAAMIQPTQEKDNYHEDEHGDKGVGGCDVEGGKDDLCLLAVLFEQFIRQKYSTRLG